MTRLNLMCGDDRLDGWTNVDLRPECADVVCDASKLEHWADGSCSEVRVIDGIEHYPAFRTADILAEWRRVLEPGGTLTLKVPNMFQLARWIVNDYQVEASIRNIMGGHRWGPDGAWDTHHTNWTPRTLAATLDAAGFDVVSNDEAMNMTVVATKR